MERKNPDHEAGAEKKVTFYEGTPQEHTAILHTTPDHEYVGAHKHAGGPYGAAAVAEKLKGLDFPASKQEVIEHLGDEVQWSKDQKVNLRVIFDRLPETLTAPPQILELISDNLEEAKEES